MRWIKIGATHAEERFVFLKKILLCSAPSGRSRTARKSFYERAKIIFKENVLCNETDESASEVKRGVQIYERLQCQRLRAATRTYIENCFDICRT